MAQLAKRETPPIVALLEQRGDDIARALPEGYTPARFQSVCINLVRATPRLLETRPITFLASVMMAAQLGLEPGGPLGLSWIIPRRNRGVWEANFQLGANGLRELAYRSGAVRTVEHRIVWAGEKFERRYGSGGVVWMHEPSDVAADRGDWTHVYAYAQLCNGGELFEAMSAAQVDAHVARYVPHAAKSDAWRDNRPEMARKTVMAALCRQLPKSSEIRAAMLADGRTPLEIEPNMVGALAALDAEVVPDDAPTECGRCGSVHLAANGTCPDCDAAKEGS